MVVGVVCFQVFSNSPGWIRIVVELHFVGAAVAAADGGELLMWCCWWLVAGVAAKLDDLLGCCVHSELDPRT